MCHSAIETTYQLFSQCPFARLVWEYFVCLLHLPEVLDSVHAIWEVWREAVRPSMRIVGDLVVKAIVWCIWLAKIYCIFNANCIPSYSLMLKVDYLLLSWFSSMDAGRSAKFEEASSVIHHSLEFLGPRVEESRGTLTFEETQEQVSG